MSAFIGQQALAGNAFFGSTAVAGVAIPVSTTTSPVFGLWNPAGSGVMAVLDKLALGIATLGTNIVGALGWMITLSTGSGLGTPISAFTDGTIRNAKIGAGKAPACRFTGSAATLGAAGTFLMSVSFTSTTGTVTDEESPLVFDHDGMLIVTPGVFIHLAGSAAPGSTYQATLSWAEVPFIQ